MTPEITAFFHEPTNTVSYLVADPETKACAVIDSVLDYDADAAPHRDRARRRHRRGDPRGRAQARLDPRDPCARRPPVGGALPARQPRRPHRHRREDHHGPAHLRRDLQRRARLRPRRLAVRPPVRGRRAVSRSAGWRPSTWRRPGHTPACGSYKVGDNIFVGDTLFMPDYGTARCDFPGGDARTMYRSIRRILDHHPQTVLWVCHDYKAPGRDDYAWRTTVGAEREQNPQVRDGIGEDEFVAMREAQGRDPRHPEAPDPVDPGQHARRPHAAARGQRHQLPEGADQRHRPAAGVTRLSRCAAGVA